MPNVTRHHIFAAAPGVLAPAGLVHAARATIELRFVLHAAFFSRETHQREPLDPQVFVRDRAAKAGVGPQGIRHAAGLRPAFLADPAAGPRFTAERAALGFTLAEWLAARGSVAIAPSGGSATVACRFTALRLSGVYGLYENHVDENPVGFTPLDGAGTANDFVAGANGQASPTVHAPHPLTHANAVLLVYHSDGHSHGLSRGQPGITAHHQLIARILR